VTFRKTKQFRSTVEERVTFVIKSENRSAVLGRVVHFFEDSNVEIDALYMIRRHGSDSLRIHVTVDTNQEVRQRIEANLRQLLHVKSVKSGKSTEIVPDESRDEESEERAQS
jgi:acetolactate synthase small subunit